MAVTTTNRRVVLDRLPDGALSADCFRSDAAPTPEPGPGEALCRTILLSLDPANRAWMRGRTYRDQLRAGDVMAGYTLSEVVDPGDGPYPAGTIVAGEAGWQEYAALPVAGLQPVVPRGPLSHHMSVLGITGLTAYFGLLDVGRPQAGDTVAVSAAAGATGNVVGQLAKAAGARVVGISGADAKNRVLEEQLGFDVTVNHRGNLRAALKEACPEGIDVYFDNVGGAVLDAVLPRMAERGRIVCCGTVSQYEQPGMPAGAVGVPSLVITRRLRMEGFIVLDYADRFAAAEADLAARLADGALRALEDVVDGLDAAPAALVGMLAGENVGKRLVRVAEDPA
jgi:NADPH-dependent curcumin reductase CurA